MNPFEDETAQSAAALRAATAQLTKARQRFEACVRKRFEPLARRREDLQGKLAAAESAAREGREQFAKDFSQKRQRMTRTAASTLAFLHGDELLADELRKALAAVTDEWAQNEPDARALYRDYLASYEAAYAALARHEAWQALAAHGAALAQAVALVSTVPLASDALQAAGGGVQVARAGFVWSALLRLARDMNAGPNAPKVLAALGLFDPCFFDSPNAQLIAEQLARERDADDACARAH